MGHRPRNSLKNNNTLQLVFTNTYYVGTMVNWGYQYRGAPRYLVGVQKNILVPLNMVLHGSMSKKQDITFTMVHAPKHMILPLNIISWEMW